MPARLLTLVLVALLAFVGVACGGEDEDVETLLRETFTGDKQVDSGRLALELRIDAQGSEQVQGPVALSLSGPFQRRGADELPAFDLDAKISGAGITYEMGATSTGDRGFINFQSQDYVVSEEVFEQFRAGFEQARAERSGDGGEADLATLGIDPRRWLIDARNAGESQVGEAETIKITGGVDVAKLLDDLGEAGERAGELDPGAGSGVPSRLTREQKERIDEAVERMTVEIHTGEEDRILRRIVLVADVRAPAGTEEFESADVRLDYSITELNQDQEIQAPADPRPFAELERQLRALGLAGSRGDERGSSRASRRGLRRYSRCVERAAGDSAAVRRCADQL